MKFLVNEVPYDENNTDSMVNMDFRGDKDSYSNRILEECSWFEIDYMKRIQQAPEDRRDPKSIFKYIFGEQQICKNYSCRNWIWTFSDSEEENTLYVLVSKEGTNWEFDRTSEDYDKVIDIRKEVEDHIYENIV